MEAPCVLVMKKDFLIKRAIAGLLTAGFNVEVAVSEAADLCELVDDTLKIKPEAILLSESMSVDAQDSMSKLLRDSRGLKVIVVSEQSNWLRVFSKKDLLLTELKDLFHAIASESTLST